MSLTQAILALVSEHADTLAIDPSTLTSERADRVVNGTKVQTTAELLLLLARFHADVDDDAGAALLAEFAARFAAHEATVV